MAKVASEPKKEKELAPFDGAKLRMVADGFYKYKCEENTLVAKETFHGEAAKMFGLRKGDIVYVIDEDSVKLVLV